MPLSTYAQRQIARDREHEAQLAEWVKTLPPEEQFALQAKGLDQVPHDFHNERGIDISEREDLEEIPESAPAKAQAQAIVGLRFVFAELLNAKQKGLYTECAASAMGIIFSNDSEAEIARRHHVTRAAVSKIIVQFTKWFGLPPRGPMRKLTLRAKYAHRAIQVHIANDCRKIG